MNTNEREIVIRHIWPGNAGVPPACDGETGRRDAGTPKGQSSIRATDCDFYRPQAIFFAKAADSFLQLRRVPLTWSTLRIQLCIKNHSQLQQCWER